MKRKSKLRSGSLHCSPTEGDNRNAERSGDRGVRPVGGVDVLETIRQECIKHIAIMKFTLRLGMAGDERGTLYACGVAKAYEEVIQFCDRLKDQEETKPRS